MIVDDLTLQQFRVYRSANLKLNANITVIVGGNAQGKSTLLEAAHLLLTGKSPRTRSSGEMIRVGATQAVVRAHTSPDLKQSQLLEVTLTPEGQNMKRNNQLVATPMDRAELPSTVMFMPEDVSIVSGEPRRRRAFLDEAMSRLSMAYYMNLMRYRKALKQRNAALKAAASSRGLSPPTIQWDEQIVIHGARLLNARREFVADLNKHAFAHHSVASSGSEALSVKYDSTVLKLEGSSGKHWKEMTADETEELFRRELVKSQERDRRFCATHVGPHRDDVALDINEVNARDFGSAGQQRTAVLSLKLAVADLICVREKRSPLLLLDDVLSQLDEPRRYRLMECVVNYEQTLLTATECELIPPGFRDSCSFIRVQGGDVRGP